MGTCVIAGGIQLTPDARDAAIHHVGRRYHIGPSLRLACCGSRQQLKGCVVVDLPAAHNAAVAVARILVEADVANHQKLRHFLLQSSDGALNDSVGSVGAGAHLVLLFRNAEENHRRNAEARHTSALLYETIDRPAEIPRHGVDFISYVRPRTDKHRVDERARAQTGLGDKTTQTFAPAEAALSMCRKWHGSVLGSEIAGISDRLGAALVSEIKSPKSPLNIY